MHFANLLGTYSILPGLNAASASSITFSAENISFAVAAKRMRLMHFGYRIVIALILTSFMPLSLGLSCAGIFYPSLAAYLQVEPGMLSYYTSILWLAALVTLPFLGNLLNKKDARICMVGAVSIIVIAFIFLSLLTALWQFYIAAFAMGIGIAMLLFLAPSTLINRWFHKRAGFYLGIVMAFTGIGGVVWSSVGGILIEQVGWSATYLVFAALSACTLPCAALMISSHPHEKGLSAVGLDTGDCNSSTSSILEGSAGTAGKESEANGISASKAFEMPMFYLICTACFLLNIGMYLYFMIPSYSLTLPIGIEFALLGATASSVAMAGQTASKLALGAIGEKSPELSTISALILGIAGVLLFLLAGNSIPVFYIAAFLFGIYYGITNVMMPILTKTAFGNKDYAQIYSRVSMVASVSNAAAAFIWGTVIDATQSYIPLFIGVAILMALTIVSLGMIRILRNSTRENRFFINNQKKSRENAR